MSVGGDEKRRFELNPLKREPQYHRHCTVARKEGFVGMPLIMGFRAARRAPSLRETEALTDARRAGSKNLCASILSWESSSIGSARS